MKKEVCFFYGRKYSVALSDAEINGTLNNLVESPIRRDLLIIDEIGYIELHKKQLLCSSGKLPNDMKKDQL